MGIGKNIKRVDAWAKVTGQAKYTQDYMDDRMLVAKVVHSTIANMDSIVLFILLLLRL